MDRETQLQLIEMGLTSPVTKESAGVARAIKSGVNDSLCEWELGLAM